MNNKLLKALNRNLKAKSDKDAPSHANCACYQVGGYEPLFEAQQHCQEVGGYSQFRTESHCNPDDNGRPCRGEGGWCAIHFRCSKPIGVYGGPFWGACLGAIGVSKNE